MWPNLQLSNIHKPEYKLITFYKFVDIPENELKKIGQEHLDFCRDLGIKGRVYIGKEWISSTITGNTWQVKCYKMYLDNSKYFKNVEGFYEKATKVDGHKFPRISVKIREEIVKLGLNVTEDEVQKYKKVLSPEEVKKIVDEKNDDYLILDMRNDYEYRLWHLKWAIPAGTINFREVPSLLKKYGEKAKWKKILWYCTWGIRCEKAAVVANKASEELGTEFYAIDWWVMGYVNSFNDGNWLGNLYTFDDRVSMQIWDSKTHTTIWECLYSGELTDNCENCRYSPCNARIIAKPKEYKKHMWFCSEECFKKAYNDLLVKDISGDPMEYKKLRKEIKNDPSKAPEVMKKFQAHLDMRLAGVEFPHKHSQKEDVIIEA